MADRMLDGKTALVPGAGSGVGPGGVETLFDAFYLSATTFTTLGFGDLTPMGAIRVLSGCEALTGLVQRAKVGVQGRDAIGVRVRDLDVGLLDFPAYLDGEIVLLCWKLGEEKIEYWHSLEAGYRGRQPVDGRFPPENPDKTN